MNAPDYNLLRPILFALTLLGFLSTSAWTQVTLNGFVTNSETGAPLDAVHVFIANTSKGTFSDEEGKFNLSDIQPGIHELVVSFIGFETKTRQLIYTSPGNYDLKIALQPTSIELATVNVISQKHKKWNRYLGRFQKAFFGNTNNAKNISILNPEALHFEMVDGALTAKAQELLKLQNKSTGYDVLFYLEHFETKGTSTAFGGKPFFLPLTPANEEEKAEWEYRRQHTYKGSLSHFLKALMQNKVRDEGFEMYNAQLVNQSDFETIRGLSRNMLIHKKGQKNYLRINDFLKVVYTKENDDLKGGSARMGRSLSGLGRRAERDMILQEMNQNKESTSGQASYLFAKKSALAIDMEGVLEEPQYLLEYGYWANEGVADWLPREYLPSSVPIQEIEAKQKQTYPKKNGFVLENLLIPAQDIHKGGPPKDGIPSIDKPQFMAGEYARFVNEEEYVLGVHFNGVAKAYPIKIMDRHEIVNDRFNGKGVAVTYCPLCGSGIAFEAEVEGKKMTFGVSGLLYNSDVLMYDRQTESLWSQIESKAVSGTHSGQPLTSIPTSFTTWQQWKKRFPETLVLTTDTGFPIDYSKKAYIGYESSQKLFFPVANESKKLKRKERVIGLEINGNFKAYPISRLAKQTSPISDQFQGQKVLIYYDKESNSAYITNEKGEEWSTVSLYWFAWYAFHPDTEIFGMKK